VWAGGGGRYAKSLGLEEVLVVGKVMLGGNRAEDRAPGSPRLATTSVLAEAFEAVPPSPGTGSRISARGLMPGLGEGRSGWGWHIGLL